MGWTSSESDYDPIDFEPDWAYEPDNPSCPECGSDDIDGYKGWCGAPNGNPPEPPEEGYAECRECGWEGSPEDLK